LGGLRAGSGGDRRRLMTGLDLGLDRAQSVAWLANRGPCSTRRAYSWTWHWSRRRAPSAAQRPVPSPATHSARPVRPGVTVG